VWERSGDFADYARTCRTAMQIPHAAFCAMETFRWAFRSVLRLHGHRYRKQMRIPIVTPTLQLHGELDPAVLADTAMGSGRYVIAPYHWRPVEGAGPFLHRDGPALG